ncbi:MAG: 2-dehydro-3-deoxyglucarate aldolase [Chloroflexi bacterium]|nr:2-dehydro-3-deoxyglucarate aldolase [Chloroflexota bacterium]
MHKYRIKEKLAAGQPVFGAMVGVPSPNVVEMLGWIGFDWVLIDAEHGSINETEAEGMVRACEVADIAPIVRPPTNRPEVILRFMDRGALGVQVPHVMDAAGAKAVVDAVKYYPLGRRGVGPSRPAFYNIKGSQLEYLETANRETFVCLMIEDVEGVENLKEMVKVDGVDVFFVGTGDLSQSMGFPGRRDVPEVQQMARRAVDTIVRAGRTAGVSCPEQDTPAWLERGVRYFHTSIGSLVRQGGRWYMGLVGASAPK